MEVPAISISEGTIRRRSDSPETADAVGAPEKRPAGLGILVWTPNRGSRKGLDYAWERDDCNPGSRRTNSTLGKAIGNHATVSSSI